MRRTHHLKTWPGPFQATLDRVKPYEIRRDDRGFVVGDALVLEEFDPGRNGHSFIEAGYTGRIIRATITYKSEPGSWGLPPTLCVLGISVDQAFEEVR